MLLRAVGAPSEMRLWPTASALGLALTLALTLLVSTMGVDASGGLLLAPARLQRSHDVHLRFQTVKLPADVSAGFRDPAWINGLSRLSKYEEGERMLWFLHVKGPVTAALRARLERALAPTALGRYVPHNTFVVSGPSPRAGKHFVEWISCLRAVEEVASLLEVDPDHKSSRAIRNLALGGNHPWRSPGALLVHIATGMFDNATARAVALERWETALGGAARLRQATEHVLVAELAGATKEAALEVAGYFARRPEVEWVEPRQLHALQNNYARYVIQDNRFNMTRIWDHGLRGEGLVVAISDTGVDYDNCFFADPTQPLAYGPGHANFEHRKIVSYVNLAPNGDGDEVMGHGTHTAGSIAADVQTSDAARMAELAPFNGMANKAKLAVFDFKSANDQGLYIPEAFYEQYLLESLRTSRASVSSNSWGAPDPTYDHFCVEVDRFVRDFPTYLPVFAAGNYGAERHDNNPDNYQTVSTPGVAKNVLTVGSSKNSRESFRELGVGYQFRAAGVLFPEAFRVRPALFGKLISEMEPFSNVSVIVSQPEHACTSLLNEDVHGKVVLVKRRRQCHFTDSAKNVQTAGGVFMLLVEDVFTGADPVLMGGEDPSIVISAASVGQLEGDALIQNANSIALSGPFFVEVEGYSERFMSDFSSRGPTEDNRVKPDVLAPGEYIRSALSDGSTTSHNCNPVGNAVVQMQGTSMATPVAAGAVALVRQYFLRGFYPSGRATESDAFDPAASLVKAILINSGQQVGGQVSNENGRRFDVTAPPSFFQGYGRIELGQVLWFDPESPVERAHPELNASAWRLFASNETRISTHDVHTLCFRVQWPPQVSQPESTSPADSFRATLVWTDPVSSLLAGRQLVNNLDLAVVDHSSGTLHVGNAGWARTGDSVLDSEYDSLNNVEQVRIARPSQGGWGFYSVHVRGTNVPEGPQAYSLVVTGSMERVREEQCPAATLCADNCGGPLRGVCDSAQRACICKSGYFGPSCAQAALQLAPIPPTDNVTAAAWSAVSNFTSLQFRYLMFEVSQPNLNDGSAAPLALRVSMTRISGGDPELYVRFGTPPDLGSEPGDNCPCWVSKACDPCGERSVVEITPDEVRNGVFYIGVFGGCCTGGGFEVRVELFKYSGPARKPLSNQPGMGPFRSTGFVIAVAISAITLAATLLVVMVHAWSRRSARYAALPDAPR